jgi:hypothetical protein
MLTADARNTHGQARTGNRVRRAVFVLRSAGLHHQTAGRPPRRPFLVGRRARFRGLVDGQERAGGAPPPAPATPPTPARDQGGGYLLLPWSVSDADATPRHTLGKSLRPPGVCGGAGGAGAEEQPGGARVAVPTGGTSHVCVRHLHGAAVDLTLRAVPHGAAATLRCRRHAPRACAAAARRVPSLSLSLTPSPSLSWVCERRSLTGTCRRVRTQA